MKKNSGPIHTGARSSSKVKQRKTNRIYNISITVVIALILIVGASILLGKDETKQASTSPDKSASTKQADTKNDDKEKSKTEDKETSSKGDDNKEDDEEIDAELGTDETEPAELTEVEESGDDNVENTYTSESWDSVGTEQSSSDQVTDFTKGSTNWVEMESAIAAGAGISSDNMTVFWLGNGGGPGKATGTVSDKETKQIYRVNIEWVDGSGWKPVKMQKLKENKK